VDDLAKVPLSFPTDAGILGRAAFRTAQQIYPEFGGPIQSRPYSLTDCDLCDLFLCKTTGQEWETAMTAGTTPTSAPAQRPCAGEIGRSITAISRLIEGIIFL
jgi:hypothetical protein